MKVSKLIIIMLFLAILSGCKNTAESTGKLKVDNDDHRSG